MTISHAQHTVGDNAILYAGEYNDSSDTRSIYMLDIENPTEPIEIGQISGFDGDAGWSPDGRYVYMVSRDTESNRTLTLYDVNADTLRVMTSHLFENTCFVPIYWSPDGRYMAYQQINDEHVEMVLWDSSSDESYTIEDVREEAFFYEGMWSPEGRYLVLVHTEANRSFIWDTVNRRVVTTIQADMYHDFQWSLDEHYMIYIDYSDNSEITIYNLTDSSQLSASGSEIVSVSPNGRYVMYFQQGASGEPSSLYLYDIEMQQETLISDEAWLYDSQFSPDSQSMTYQTMDNTHRTLEQYNIATDTTSQLLSQVNLIRTVRWSASSEYVAVVYVTTGMKEESGSLSVYQRGQGLLRQFDYSIPNIYYAPAIHWSPVGDYLVIDAGVDGDVIFDVYTNSMIELSAWTEVNPWIFRQWSNDGQHIIFYGRSNNVSGFYSYDFMKEEAIALTAARDWGSFIGWRGTNQNGSLIHCGEG